MSITLKSSEQYRMYSSNKAFNSRAFDSFWRPFVRFFQALCLSHYSTFRPDPHFGHLAYFITFSFCNVLTTIYTLHIVWTMDKIQYKNSCLMYYVSCASIIVHVIVYSVGHFEAIATKTQESEIYQKYREIDKIFATKLSYVQDFNAVRKHYVWPVFNYWILSGAASISTSIYSNPTIFYQIQIFLNFWYFCMIAERCENAVRVKNNFELH